MPWARMRSRVCLILIILAGSACPVKAGDASPRDSIVAGGPGHFLEVHHVVLKGSDFAIGQAIGETARELGITISVTGDRLRNRVQREYLRSNCPAMYERMKGVAQAYGLDITDDRYDFSLLPLYLSPPGSGGGRPGCSAVFYPAPRTADGHSILSRNYDFTTGTIQGSRPGPGVACVMSRPYVFEMHPRKGYASIGVCAFDLLGGVLDGINSQGLAVAVLADDETIVEFGLQPIQGVGMHELMSMRYLLDNCRDVEEAKQAMLSLKHYYGYIPCHYIVCDRSGESCVFEFPPSRNGLFLIEGEGPQCVTNHLLANYDSVDELPREAMIDSYDRFRTLHAATSSRTMFDLDAIIAINSEVMALDTPSEDSDRAPNRTLWHALYDTQDASVRIKFYLGEEPDPAGGQAPLIRYSDYLTFSLGEID